MPSKKDTFKINEFVALGESKIHNKGVFALKNIPTNTKVIEYVGELISKEEGNRRQNEYETLSKKDPSKGAVYIFDLDKEHDLDGTCERNYAKNVNHSCEPNCKYQIKNKKVWIVSIRPIKKGEEISYNYGFEWDPKDFMDFPCKCGSNKCVGYILEEKSWPKLKKYLKEEGLNKKIKK